MMMLVAVALFFVLKLEDALYNVHKIQNHNINAETKKSRSPNCYKNTQKSLNEQIEGQTKEIRTNRLK